MNYSFSDVFCDGECSDFFNINSQSPLSLGFHTMYEKKVMYFLYYIQKLILIRMMFWPSFLRLNKMCIVYPWYMRTEIYVPGNGEGVNSKGMDKTWYNTRIVIYTTVHFCLKKSNSRSQYSRQCLFPRDISFRNNVTTIHVNIECQIFHTTLQW